MTEITSYIVSLIGTFPFGLEFLLPIFSFILLIIGLILIALIFLAFAKIVRG